MKINIGGGYKRFDGFVNLDHDELTNPDFIVNLEKDRLPFEDNSVDEIKAHHILEHIGEGFFHLLQELYRVCKNGALFDIVVPHHRHEHFYGDPTHRRFITIEMMKQFSLKWCTWHKEHFGSSSGFAPRLKVDFEIIDFEYSVDDTYKKLWEENKTEELMELNKRFINVFKDTIIKMIVVKNAT